MVEKSWSSIIPDKIFWVGVGEARAEVTEMALRLGSKNATTALRRWILSAKPEDDRDAMKAAAACRDKDRRPRPPTFLPSCDWHHAPLGTSMAAHRTKYHCTSSSKDRIAYEARLGG